MLVTADNELQGGRASLESWLIIQENYFVVNYMNRNGNLGYTHGGSFPLFVSVHTNYN